MYKFPFWTFKMISLNQKWNTHAWVDIGDISFQGLPQLCMKLYVNL